MSNIGIGFTILPEPREAAAYMVNEARAKLSGRPQLAVLFSTTDYEPEQLVMSVQRELGDVPIWGGSSSTGVFANDRWITGDRGAAALMLIANRPAGASVACVEDDPVRAGKEATLAAVKQAGGHVSALLTLAFMGPEEKLLEGVMQVVPGAPVVGGSASDHHAESKFFQYGDGHAHMGAFTLGAIGGEVGYAFAHGYRLTGKRAVITKATGRRIITLDNRPALDVYAEWTNQKKVDLLGSAILVYSVYHPLLMHKHDTTLSVHPVGGNEEGTIDTGVAMIEGVTLELGESTPDELIHAVAGVIRNAAKNVKKPEAVILSHCGGRAIGLGDRIGEAAGEVRKAVGEVPWIGYLAFGEQGCIIPGEASHANLSLSALVLGSKN